MNEKDLCKKAIEAAKNSYAPYSGYNVGAALLTKEGNIYLGANIENAAYPATVCAERTAIFKAVSEGERDFSMLAVVGVKDGVVMGDSYPCGVCRQVMSEFCKKDFPVLIVKSEEEYEKYTLADLLPFSFVLDK